MMQSAKSRIQLPPLTLCSFGAVQCVRCLINQYHEIDHRQRLKFQLATNKTKLLCIICSTLISACFHWAAFDTREGLIYFRLQEWRSAGFAALLSCGFAFFFSYKIKYFFFYWSSNSSSKNFRTEFVLILDQCTSANRTDAVPEN